MGPFIPSITLTNSYGVTRTLSAGEKFYKGSDGARHEFGKAMTSKGNTVKVFKADPDDSLYDQYFCHGHSLGTYRRFGYSVCSGRSILRAFQDDYVEIVAVQTALDALQGLKVGDIISLSDFEDDIIHTAKVFLIDINPSDPFRPIKLTNIILSTKNGYDPDCLQPILAVCDAYPEAPKIRFWRAKTCFDDTMQQ